MPFAQASQVGAQNFLLPVPHACPISQLLARCNKFCGSSPSVTAQATSDSMRIFVNESFEIVDHSQLVGECFTDFMEVTVKALLTEKLSSVPKKSAFTTPVVKAVTKHITLPEKKFTREPTTMDSLMKTIKDKKTTRVNSDMQTPVKRQKLDEKSEAVKSPEKESKNARKRRERKELEKKLHQASNNSAKKEHR